MIESEFSLEYYGNNRINSVQNSFSSDADVRDQIGLYLRLLVVKANQKFSKPCFQILFFLAFQIVILVIPSIVHFSLYAPNIHNFLIFMELTILIVLFSSRRTLDILSTITSRKPQVFSLMLQSASRIQHRINMTDNI